MPKRAHQVAALPWRMSDNGIEILLVTTRTTKRWVVPKGWTMAGKADHEAAAVEAYEEAGLIGLTEAKPIGNYCYTKISDSGKSRPVEVRVFSMRVQEVLDEWPERLERERQWVSPQRALELIGEPELLPVVARFDRHKLGLFARLKLWWRKVFR